MRRPTLLTLTAVILLCCWPAGAARAQGCDWDAEVERFEALKGELANLEAQLQTVVGGGIDAIPALIKGLQKPSVVVRRLSIEGLARIAATKKDEVAGRLAAHALGDQARHDLPPSLALIALRAKRAAKAGATGWLSLEPIDEAATIEAWEKLPKGARQLSGCLQKLAQKDLEGAAALAAELEEGPARAYLELRIELARGRAQEALNSARETDFGALAPEALYVIGRVLYSAGQRQQAAQVFERSLAIYPLDARILANTAMLGAPGGMERMNAAIALDPKSAVLYRLRAELRWRGLRQEQQPYTADGFAEALEDLDRCIALDPKDGLAYGRKGFLEVRRMDFAAALEDLSRAAELDTERTWLWRGERGLLHAQRQRPEEARPDLEFFLESAPPGHPMRPSVEAALAQLSPAAPAEPERPRPKLY